MNKQIAAGKMGTASPADLVTITEMLGIVARSCSRSTNLSMIFRSRLAALSEALA